MPIITSKNGTGFPQIVLLSKLIAAEEILVSVEVMFAISGR